ncbi:unnamed protein product, partial [Discosporangium mesarthrocarpum]
MILLLLAVVASLANVSAYSTCRKITVASSGDQLQLAGVFTLDGQRVKEYHGTSIFCDDGFCNHRLAFQTMAKGRKLLRGTQAGDAATEHSLKTKVTRNYKGSEGTWAFSSFDSEGKERRILVDDCAEHPVDITSDKWMVSYPGCTTCTPSQYIETPVAITCAQEGDEVALLELFDAQLNRRLDTSDIEHSKSYSYSYIDSYNFWYSYWYSYSYSDS